MGFWSSLGDAIGWGGSLVSGLGGFFAGLAGSVWGFFVGLFDFFLGFLAWPPKRLRLHVCVLSDATGQPVIDPALLVPALDEATRVLKDRFNVRLRPYSASYVEVLKGPAPAEALTPPCGADLYAAQVTSLGAFYNRHRAGWVGPFPISLTFPITAYVVADVANKRGCSLGPSAEWLVIDPTGINGDLRTLVHEIGHACSLWHSASTSNIMWENSDRGDRVKWFQKNLLRSSRHVTYF